MFYKPLSLIPSGIILEASVANSAIALLYLLDYTDQSVIQNLQ